MAQLSHELPTNAGQSMPVDMRQYVPHEYRGARGWVPLIPEPTVERVVPEQIPHPQESDQMSIIEWTMLQPGVPLPPEDIAEAAPAVLEDSVSHNTSEFQSDSLGLGLKPAEAKRIADEEARGRRAGIRKNRLERLAEASRKWGGDEIQMPRGNDSESRRERTRIAKVFGKKVPYGRPPLEKPRQSWGHIALGPDVSTTAITQEEYSSIQKVSEIEAMWELHEQDELPEWEGEVGFAPAAQIVAMREGIFIEKVDGYLDLYDVRGLRVSAEEKAERELIEGEEIELEALETYEETLTAVDKDL